MSRGKGSKSKLKGRISGYETADFSIVSNMAQISSQSRNSVKTSPIYNEKKKVGIFNKIRKVIIYIILIIIGLFILIGVVLKLNKSSDNYGYDSTYVEPKIMTPESADSKPTAFTQRQLDAEYARDEKIAALLVKEWIMTDGASPSSHYVIVGKKWESISSNQSSILSVSTSYEYEPDDQKYETCSLRINLQETKKNGGIVMDVAVANILNIYNPSINIDSVNSSVQAAYNSTINSKPYEGSLSFDKDRVYITGGKSGQLTNVTINIDTSISIN